MPPGKYGMQGEWEKEGVQEIMMDFLLPTGIFLKFPVSPNDTIKNIKRVCALTSLCIQSITAFNDQLNQCVSH